MVDDEGVSPAGRAPRFRRSPRNDAARSLLGVGAADGNRGALEVAAVLLADLKAGERRNRTLKLQADHARKRASADERWRAGAAPYGWRSVGGGRLEAVKGPQVVVGWIFRQREQGYGWQNIADRLNEAGTPGPGGGKWYQSSVRRVVQRGRGWVPRGAVSPAGRESG